MSMTDREAAAILRSLFAWVIPARGNGKPALLAKWTEAIGRGAAALERKAPRPVTVKGRLFRRRYCPACHERVKRGGRFCHACGQAIRGPVFHAPEPSYHIPAPPPPPRQYGTRAEIVIFDEIDAGRR